MFFQGAGDASDSTSTTMVIDTESQAKSSITGSAIEAKGILSLLKFC